MPHNQDPALRDSLFQWQTRALLFLFCSASVILVIGQYTNLDLYIADYYFDVQRQLFPWDRTWFGRDLMHGYVKNVIVWTGFLIIGVTLFDLVFPLSALSTPRRAGLRILALSSFLEPTLIRGLKEGSSLHCPWGVDRYGGSHPFLRLLDAVPDGWGAGHCFPAGHARTAVERPAEKIRPKLTDPLLMLLVMLLKTLSHPVHVSEQPFKYHMPSGLFSQSRSWLILMERLS